MIARVRFTPAPPRLPHSPRISRPTAACEEEAASDGGEEHVAHRADGLCVVCAQ